MKQVTIYVLTVVFNMAVVATSASAAEGEEHAHEFHANTLYGFIGITGEDRRERAGTVAIEYERRFNERWGLAAGAERAFGDLDFTVFTVPLVFHHGDWGFYAGPGIEKSDHHDSEFIVGNVILAPKFNIDFVDGDAVIVGGLAIGFGF
jgi:hypothetical protein